MVMSRPAPRDWRDPAYAYIIIQYLRKYKVERVDALRSLLAATFA
jgi:hypothetical protein